MSILDEIVANKRKEVEQTKRTVPVNELESRPLFNRTPVSLVRSLANGSGIIAEIKRKSPSKGMMNPDIDVATVASGYFNAGVSGISVLTDYDFFGGITADLVAAREQVSCPILRKDFMIDEYQVVEAKSIGADVILLIAACLRVDEIRRLTDVAHAHGLEVLLEVHNEEELESTVDTGADLIGVNNRNLKTFDVSLETSKRLASRIPDTITKISESGISTPEHIVDLISYGYKGFLMGENFMKTKNPDEACVKFIQELNKLKAGV